MDAVTHPPVPVNEPVLDYAAGSPERARLAAELAAQAAGPVELTMTIGGTQRMAAGDRVPVRAPHRHELLLGETAQAPTAGCRRSR
jgi:1-pyrroline-5-carboxylate dehydrogenase